MGLVNEAVTELHAMLLLTCTLNPTSQFGLLTVRFLECAERI